jgi:hypothetical protein
MHLVIVIALDFFVQYAAGILLGGDLFQGTSAHDAILQPTLKTLNRKIQRSGFGSSHQNRSFFTPENA